MRFWPFTKRERGCRPQDRIYPSHPDPIQRVPLRQQGYNPPPPGEQRPAAPPLPPPNKLQKQGVPPPPLPPQLLQWPQSLYDIREVQAKLCAEEEARATFETFLEQYERGGGVDLRVELVSGLPGIRFTLVGSWDDMS